jgi:microcystin-dependent protein
LQTNVLIAGTPYVAIYNSSDAVFYLQGNAGGTYGVPLGGGMHYFGTTAPSSAFVFPTGQAISRAAFPACFSLFGTTYGSGDGTTTFNVPDLRGRVLAMKEATATRLTTAGGGVDGGTLGAVGGSEAMTILTANLPAYTPAGTNSITITTGTNGAPLTISSGGGSLGFAGGANANGNLFGGPGGITITSGFTGTPAPGQISTPTKNVQPTLVSNFILRII